jgi:hypothetical protein
VILLPPALVRRNLGRPGSGAGVPATVNALRPFARINPGNPGEVGHAWPDAPITISSGGTYTGLRIKATGTGRCVNITTSAQVTLVDCDFWGESGAAVWDNNANAKLDILNCRFFGSAGPINTRMGRTVDFQFGERFVFQHNSVQGFSSVFVGDFSVGCLLDIRYNVFIANDARLSDGSGGFQNNRGSAPWAQAFQISAGGANMRSPHANSQFAWNECWNPFDECWVEDTINFYNVTGISAAQPLVVEHNLCSRASLTPSNSADSYSGGGIIVDSANMSAAPVVPEHIIFRHNTVVETDNYGIAIATGRNNSILNNTILRTGFNDAGQALVTRDTGVYVRNNESVPNFGGHKVENNDLGWMRSNGTQNHLSGTANSYTDINNTKRSSCSKTDVDNAISAYRQARIAAGIATPGATR